MTTENSLIVIGTGLMLIFMSADHNHCCVFNEAVLLCWTTHVVGWWI